ncbi:MAG TPA: hypothetical protein PLI18_01545 [Pirellulaceae bacterium]|nr:hypothetical protein [Pirellulaceae bacterium]
MSAQRPKHPPVRPAAAGSAPADRRAAKPARSTSTEASPTPSNDRAGARRIAIVLGVAAVGALAAYPFRGSKIDGDDASRGEVVLQRFASGTPATREANFETSPPLPGRVPFANRVAQRETVIDEPSPLPAERRGAPPSLASPDPPSPAPAALAPPLPLGETRLGARRDAPRVAPAEVERRADPINAARLLPEELRALARDGRWPVEAKPLPTELPVSIDARSFDREGTDNGATRQEPHRAVAGASPAPGLPASFSFGAASVGSTQGGSMQGGSATGEASTGGSATESATPRSNWQSTRVATLPPGASATSTPPRSTSIQPSAPGTPPSVTPVNPVQSTPRGTDSPPSAAPRWRVYKVRDGDSLESIAVAFLGDPSRARELYEANRETVPASGALPLGLPLMIPPVR